MSYSFRIRINLSGRVRVETDQTEIELLRAGAARVSLKSGDEDTTIRDASQLVLAGHGFASRADAQDGAALYRSTIMAAFSALHFGADFGDRAPQGGSTAAGRAILRKETNREILDDVHGSITYQTDSDPLFLSISVRGVKGVQLTRLEAAITSAFQVGYGLSARQELSYELFSASFSQPYADARFLLLMMAVETLLAPAEREPAVQDHIARLIADTEHAALDPGEIDSIRGSLEFLRNQSITQAGKSLARTLGENRYMGMSPAKFFQECYSVRSALVHGALDRPPRQEVDSLAAHLEAFVGDLLAGPIGSAPQPDS